MSIRFKKLLFPLSVFLLGMIYLAAPALGQGFYKPSDGPDTSGEVTKDVVVTEHVGAQLPLDLTFTDEAGQQVPLRHYFTGNKPVILQLGYYGCPMLCGLMSQGMVEAVKNVSFKAGTDYELVFVSIDPKETPELANLKKQSFVSAYDRGDAAGWHFLTGKQDNIAALAKADGFAYKWVATMGRFAHPASFTICMPDGRISRYIYGVRFEPLTVRESLVEASQGKIGTVLDQAYLTCYAYDGKQGKYAMAAVGLMRAGGVLIMIIVATALVRIFRREAKLRAEGKLP
jgi:protein SCO1/2